MHVAPLIFSGGTRGGTWGGTWGGSRGVDVCVFLELQIKGSYNLMFI